MNRIPAYTIRTTQTGEQVIPDIQLNGGSIPVNYDRLPVNEILFGNIDVQVRKINSRDQHFLAAISLDSLPRAIPNEFMWEEATDDDDGVEQRDEDLGAIVLLKAKCRTSLRCPMSQEFWREWVEAGNKKSKETSILKDQIRDRYPKDYDITLSGAKIIVPMAKGNSRDQRDRYEYLIAIANYGSFEWILERSDGRPNAYRIECEDGIISLIDPRSEVALEVG